jgi:hypothetical protein
MNRLWIIRVFICAFSYIGLDHIMKDLENIAHYNMGSIGEYTEKFLKGYGRALIQPAQALIKIMHCLFYVVHGRAFI